jgi:hypothetical protein
MLQDKLMLMQPVAPKTRGVTSKDSLRVRSHGEPTRGICSLLAGDVVSVF